MGKFTAYKLPLRGMTRGTHEFEYTLDTEFFKNMESEDILKGKVDIHLTVNCKVDYYELDFTLKGMVYIPCDRCLDDMEHEVDIDEQLFIKFGHEFREESDNMLIIPEDEGEINIAWFLYEFIALTIPIKHVHPYGKCNKEMSARLQQMSARLVDEEDDDIEFTDDNQEEVERPTDPRWDALKKLKR